MKLTRWFPASVKPVREGWYECQYDVEFRVMRFWDGHYWLCAPNGQPGQCAFGIKSDRWRGVAKPEREGDDAQ